MSHLNLKFEFCQVAHFQVYGAGRKANSEFQMKGKMEIQATNKPGIQMEKKNMHLVLGKHFVKKQGMKKIIPILIAIVYIFLPTS